MLVFKLAVNIAVQTALMAGLLFLPAGTWDWWRAWVLVGVYLAARLAAVAIILPGNAELMRERLRSPIQKGQPLADKVVLTLLLAAFYGLMGFISLDVHRLRLLGGPGAWVTSLGLILYLAGWAVASLALKENSFAARVVRHQGERRQTVIDTGVYGVVRHPMYSGSLCMMLGMSLWLGSYAAAVVATVPIGMLVLRIIIEERFLRRELAGYGDYAQRVPYRLIPLLW